MRLAGLRPWQRAAFWDWPHLLSRRDLASAATRTKQAPAVHPPARHGAAMAYDAATGTVVLFGGYVRYLADTSTWG